MPRPWNAKDTAESLIEAMIMRKEIGFARDLSPANLTDMAFLDAGAIEPSGQGVCFALDRDWNSTLVSVVQDEFRKVALNRLGQAILQRNEVVSDYVKAIEAPLTKEFKPSASLTREKWERRNLYEKAHIIATQRAEKSLLRLPKPADYDDNESKYDFTVSLVMFNEGNGRHHSSTRLYFSFTTPFHSFLRLLEDATQLCVIPQTKDEKRLINETDQEISASNPGPDIPQFSRASGEGEDAGGLELQQVPSSSTLSNMTISACLDDQSSSDESATLYSPTDPSIEPQKVTVHKIRRDARPSHVRAVPDMRSAGDRGYSLYHGPWSYYIVNERNQSSGRVWNPLADSDDYAKMLQTIERLVAMHPRDTISATVMHSLDVEVYEDCCAQLLLESFENSPSDIPEGWDQSLDKVDDDGEGESYMRWLSRSLKADRI